MPKITFDGETQELDLDDRVLTRDGRDGHVYFIMFMPGLGRTVMINDSWQFNGDKKSPTFSPSLLTNGGAADRSHCFIKDGRVEFLMDCSHELKGQTVELPRLGAGAAPSTPSTPVSTPTSYLVKVTADVLNIRKGPGSRPRSYSCLWC